MNDELGFELNLDDDISDVWLLFSRNINGYFKWNWILNGVLIYYFAVKKIFSRALKEIYIYLMLYFRKQFVKNIAKQ